MIVVIIIIVNGYYVFTIGVDPVLLICCYFIV